MRQSDVLVVGGGSAGVMAAIAAARAGAKVTMLERYGCFGGLWTGGLVLIVLSTHARHDGRLLKCVRGIGDEMMERLVKIPGGIINQAPGRRNPTSDPEATKYIMDVMLAEAGVDIVLHSWVTNAIVDGGALRGVIAESKSGCRAFLAKVVVDATGDGDVFAAAGAAHVRHIHRIGLVHRLGNADRVAAAKGSKPPNLGSGTPHPSVRWVNMQGPQGDCLDVEMLTKCELGGRRAIWERLKKLQERPGHEKVFLLDTASQLGVRASRTLKGLHELRLDDAKADRVYPDVVGIGGSESFIGERPCQIPYAILVPEKVDGLLAAGRCVAADNVMLNYTRLIAPCFLTGHAAGAAAALAAQQKCRPRDLDVKQLQGLLRKQGAYLGEA
jgi:choline dehydrogenase-like flavoprotein